MCGVTSGGAARDDPSLEKTCLDLPLFMIIKFSSTSFGHSFFRANENDAREHLNDHIIEPYGERAEVTIKAEFRYTRST